MHNSIDLQSENTFCLHSSSHIFVLLSLNRTQTEKAFTHIFVGLRSSQWKLALEVKNWNKKERGARKKGERRRQPFAFIIIFWSIRKLQKTKENFWDSHTSTCVGWRKRATGCFMLLWALEIVNKID
jgi:hypothetical protein